jgi:hypothetical protein
MALLQLAASLLAQPDAVPPPAPGLFPWAHVVRVSPRPNFVSGIVMFPTDFDVQVLDGGRHMMTMTYLGPDQFIPPLGSICWINFIPARPFPGANILSPNHVLQLSCDTGRDTEHFAGGRARIAGVRIVGVTPPPPRHARRALYAGIDVESPGRTMPRLYMRRQSADGGLPAIGSLCTITYSLNWVTGRSLGNPRLEGEHVTVVDEIDCGERTAAAD